MHSYTSSWAILVLLRTRDVEPKRWSITFNDLFSLDVRKRI